MWTRGLLLVVVIGAAPGAAAASPCPPAARVAGDVPAAEEVRRILGERGLPVPAADCAGVLAAIREVPQGLETAVEDGSGRREVYTVRDPETAATLVESWARSDVASALLRARPSPQAAALAVPAPVATAPVAALVPAPAPGSLPVALSAGAGAARGEDGSAWLEAHLAGCAAFGSIRVGPLLRASLDAGAGGDSERLGGDRLALDVLVTAGWSIALGGGAVEPGIAAGAAWLRTSADRGGLADEEDLGGPRLEARLAGLAPLSPGVALELVVSAALAPLARAGDIEDDGLVYAGEPRTWLRVGAGVRWGGP